MGVGFRSCATQGVHSCKCRTDPCNSFCKPLPHLLESGNHRRRWLLKLELWQAVMQAQDMGVSMTLWRSGCNNQVQLHVTKGTKPLPPLHRLLRGTRQARGSEREEAACATARNVCLKVFEFGRFATAMSPAMSRASDRRIMTPLVNLIRARAVSAEAPPSPLRPLPMHLTGELWRVVRRELNLAPGYQTPSHRQTTGPQNELVSGFMGFLVMCGCRPTLPGDAQKDPNGWLDGWLNQPGRGIPPFQFLNPGGIVDGWRVEIATASHEPAAFCVAQCAPPVIPLCPSRHPAGGAHSRGP